MADTATMPTYGTPATLQTFPTFPTRRMAGGVREQVEDILRRWAALKAQRQNWEADWQDIIRLMVPGADDILSLGQMALGQSRTSEIFDTTGITAPQMLAANMQGAVTNPAIQWFRLRFREEALNETQAVNGWLQACDERMLAAYNASNFYQAAHTYYLNLGSFGTAAMFIGSRRSQLGTHLHFKTLPTGGYWIVENADGIVDTLYRSVWLSPRQAIQLFGMDDVSQATRDAVLENTGKADEPEEYLHCVEPRVGRDQERRDNRNMPWKDVYLDIRSKEIVKESGFEEFPFVVSRWETLSRTPWGFGPGHIALPDVRTLNKIKELDLQNKILRIQPPLKVIREGVIGNVSLESRVLNYVNSQDAIMPLELGGRVETLSLEVGPLIQSIRDIFYVDQLQGLPSPEASNMTAFEVSQRIEQMQRLMGPAFTRLLSEMLDPLADRVFGLMLRARALPQVPREVILAAQQNAGQIDVDYEGPLARSQRGVDIRAIGDTIGMTSQMVVSSQRLDLWDNYDLDGFARHVAEVNGVPKSLVVDVLQVQRMRAARMQQQAQLQAAAETRANMESMGHIAPLIQQTRPELAQAA